LESNGRQRVRLQQQLNILLGRPLDFAWMFLRLPDSTSSLPSLNEVLNRLFEVNPSLQSIQYLADGYRSEIEVARRERGPIYSIAAESSIYSGGVFRQTTIGAKMTLPFFNGSLYRANLKRSQQQQIAAEKEVEALGRELRADVVAAHTEAQDATHQSATFTQEVLPRMQSASESTRNAWLSSKASLLEVLESQRSLLAARAAQRRLVAAHLGARETLRSLVPSVSQP